MSVTPSKSLKGAELFSKAEARVVALHILSRK